MALAARFGSRLAMWTGILFVILIAVSLLMGQALTEVIAHIPVWGGLALVLAAFPAGLAVSADTLADGRPSLRPIVHMALSAAAVSVFTLLLAGYVGPAATRWLNSDVQPSVVADAAELPLHVLRSDFKRALEAARTDSLTDPVERWRTANELGWHYFSRVDGSLLPFLFGWIGVLLGYWTRMIPRSDLRQAQHWAMGLFLVMSTYLAGENSYEMIVMRAAGNATFAADLRLVVPGLLVLGLGWPTIVMLWKRHAENADT